MFRLLSSVTLAVAAFRSVACEDTGTETEVRHLLHHAAAWRALGGYGKLKLSGKQFREPRRTARTMISAAQCRSARTLLRWSVSKLASAASVTASAIDDFELERRELDAITNDAIQRAFEDVGVLFLSQDDVQLRGVISAVR
jgi:hypothetical protein